jgi:hypothetical protein
MRKLIASLAIAALLAPLTANAWWEKGHRLVANVAWDHLTPVARKNVKVLLGTESMADVASWADVYRPLETQTSGWHYVDIPGDQKTYDRDRDCPTQPGVKPGGYNDKVRDCVTDRITFFEKRVGDASLDPIDRATALKYLIHFVGDIHQPFHASGVEKGGNGITVTAFGSETCGNSPKCNLHAIWDGYLIDHRKLSEAQYLAMLESNIRQNHPEIGKNDPVLWTEQSKALSDAAMVPNNSDITEAYFQQNIPIVDRQIELGGLRLASVLNEIFTAPPTKFKPAPVAPGK